MGTVESKRSIAIFMGYANGLPLTDSLLESLYNDWNSLMPVVDKIESISPPEYNKVTFDLKFGTPTQVSWELSNGYLYRPTLSCINGETKLEAVYKAVVEFIKWYNKNK